MSPRAACPGRGIKSSGKGESKFERSEQLWVRHMIVVKCIMLYFFLMCSALFAASEHDNDPPSCEELLCCSSPHTKVLKDFLTRHQMYPVFSTGDSLGDVESQMAMVQPDWQDIACEPIVQEIFSQSKTLSRFFSCDREFLSRVVEYAFSPDATAGSLSRLCYLKRQIMAYEALFLPQLFNVLRKESSLSWVHPICSISP